ncbi:MAG: putative dioxygenase of extradiol dioxygenase family [Ilumatobacteraceae bacterium]|nr:putative dioxygenase of extradiol dioxygenase family [Ilumatobacteraceae bacterium]
MPSDDRPPFHLAFPCLDVAAAVAFYEELGATAGRVNEHAGIIGFFGHQIVAHRVAEMEPQQGIYPRHFGVMVDLEVLDRIERDLRRVAPDRTHRALRFPGEAIEHHSVQSRDPSGNVLEFKTYTRPDAPFAAVADARIGDVAVTPDAVTPDAVTRTP